jgi:hypothetical protein
MTFAIYLSEKMAEKALKRLKKISANEIHFRKGLNIYSRKKATLKKEHQINY